MTKIDDGGPAFPRNWSESWGGEVSNHSVGGMTLRDWFAGQALASLPMRRWEGDDGKTPPDILQQWANAVYGLADAMLAARGRA